MSNNYSERGIKKKQHEIKSTSSRLVSKARVTAFRFSLVLVLAAVVIGTFAGKNSKNIKINCMEKINVNRLVYMC